MPRQSIHRLSQQVIDRAAADVSTHRVQLRIEFRMSARSRTPGLLLGSVGGEWDTEERRFVGPGTKARIWYCEELQRDATVYWLAWLRAYITGDWATFEAEHGPRPFSFWTVGGRRRGKTWSGVRFLAAFAIAIPNAIPPWIVSPIEDDFLERKELHREWVKALPPSWYEWNAAKLYIKLVNGVQIQMYSAHDAGKLKDGAVGYFFWNEVQKSKAKLTGLNHLLGGAADKGALGHLASNLPREAEEYWIDDVLEAIGSGTVPGKLFDYRGDNPHVNEDALDALAGTMSAREYEIERKGNRMPRPNIVLYEFVDGPQGNVRQRPRTGAITEVFLKRRLGRPFGALVSCDFQNRPFQVALVDLYFEDPTDPRGALSWTVAEYIFERGSEDDLIDKLEADGWYGWDGVRCLACDAFGEAGRACPRCRAELLPSTSAPQLACAVVADASGDFQLSDRKKGRVTGQTSFDVFRARKWRHLYKPDERQDRNPEVADRVAAANARLHAGDRVRRAFVEPACVQTIQALKRWPNDKHGKASRFSVHAHIGDAWTYKIFRLWPRVFAPPPSNRPIEIINIHKRDDRAW